MTQDGYGQAYQKGYSKTIRVLRSRGASPDHAEDVAQWAWMRGWQKLGQLKDDGMVVSWVNAIAINCHRRVGQQEARFQSLPDLCGHIGVDSAPLDTAKILDSCRPEDRALFEQQLGGMTTPEIAKKQGVSAAAIRLRFFRARRAARASVESHASALRDSFVSQRRMAG